VNPRSNSQLSVVHLVLSLDIGGLEKVVYDLARCTDRRRFSTRIVCLGEAGQWRSKFEALGVPVEPLSVLDCGKFRCVAALARKLRELRPDILHTHNPTPHFVGAVAARLSGVPVVIHTKHGRNYPEMCRRVMVNRVASWLTSRIIPVSDDAANVARQIEKIPLQKIEVIRNGIDLDAFPCAKRPQVAGERRAIHVARLSNAAKDQRTLLRAVRIVADAEPDFVLDIVGDGADRTDLESLCDELKLRRHVNFLGFREDVHSLLSRAEFFVLSSVTEGISITLLEAAANGLPIVATAVGGNAEVVVDGTTGILVPAGAPDDLAVAMLTVLRDPARASRMGLAGRNRVEEHFNLRRTVARYERIYEDALRSRRVRSSKAVSR
jgi:glycosyltransferase involved in cell wall biosynthesis